MNTEKQVKKHKLTAYLIKDTYENIDEFLSVDGFERVEVNPGDSDQGTLIYKGGFQSKPTWVSIFQDLPSFDASTISNQSSKAIFVLRHEGRFFCFTFGYAKNLINDLAYETNFGLIITLNLSDPNAIKSIDKTNIGHIALHSKEQSTRDIALTSFEFNDDIDLLKSITGKSKSVNEEDRETLSGRDSVSIYTRVTIEDFIDVSERLLQAFTDTTYKERYPWIDKISEVRDKETVAILDNKLARKILEKKFNLVWLAIPEVVAWEDIEGFAYKFRRKTPTGSGPVLYQDLDISEWVSVTSISDDLSAKKLKSKNIHIYWQDGRPTTKWSVYRCLNAEITVDNKTYILNDSSWYNIDSAFVTETSDFYASVPDATYHLPNHEGNTEPVYLQCVSNVCPEYALMDRKVIMVGGGHSKVEFCDLFSNKNHIIHVKKYGGSSLLSHLFFQALVSGETFLFEPLFRKAVNEQLPKSHKIADTNTKPNPAAYSICIAVMSDVPGPLELPFFSKVSFKHTVKTLSKLGYQVCKLKIER